jgi:predicted XRE-type DNA-binding protein
VAINQIIQGRKLSQTAAARRLKVNQPKVSALSNYQNLSRKWFFRRSGLKPRRKGITEHGLSRLLRPPFFWRKPLKNASRRLALYLGDGFQLEGFSVERLMNFLTALDRDVDIVIHRRPGTRRGGRIVVTAA